MDRKNQDELDELFSKMHETLVDAKKNALDSQRQEQQKEDDEKTYFLETRKQFYPLSFLDQLHNGQA